MCILILVFNIKNFFLLAIKTIRQLVAENKEISEYKKRISAIWEIAKKEGLANGILYGGFQVQFHFLILYSCFMSFYVFLLGVWLRLSYFDFLLWKFVNHEGFAHIWWFGQFYLIFFALRWLHYVTIKLSLGAHDIECKIIFRGLITFYGDLMKGLGASARLFELDEIKPRIPITGLLYVNVN